MTTREVRTHLRVLRRRTELDTALANGESVGDAPALEARARQLTSPRTRRAIANTLSHLLDAAEEPPECWGPGGPRPPLQRDAVLAAAGELTELADSLRGSHGLSVQAIALASLLAWDLSSPIYAQRDDTTVAGWANAALAAA